MEVFIRVIYDLPYSIAGCTTFDANGDANIYLNGNRPLADQYEALEHEMFHIDAGHWDCWDVEAIEQETRERDGKGEKAKKWLLECASLRGD